MALNMSKINVKFDGFTMKLFSRAHIIRTTPKKAQITPLTMLDELAIRQVLLRPSAVL